MEWWDNDDLFFRELEEGRKWEFYVASKLLRAGLWVQVPTKSIRASIDGISTYADEAEIWVTRKEPAKIEVKSRRVAFTGPDDIPPDKDPFFVTTLSSWQNAATKPVAIVIVSQVTGGIVVASGRHSEVWEGRRFRDNVRGMVDTFLCAPAESLYTFDEFVRYMRAREEKDVRAEDAQ